MDQVKSSNLKFQLQQSPFSAVISLKKSFVKDKSGQILTPPKSKPDYLLHLESENQALTKVNVKKETENTSLAAENDKIQQENASIKIDLEQMRIDRDISDKT